MKKKSLNKVYSAAMLVVLAAGNIMFVRSDVWNSKAGTPLELADADAETYQVDSVSMLKDGMYLLNSWAEGYNSEDPIRVAVTFDAAGELIQQVEVTYQAETNGIGSKVADEPFLSQFAGVAAPVGLKGHPVSVVSPGTGAVWGAGAAAKPPAKEKADHRSNPERWNPEDQSPEAVAVRNLYRSGLLASAADKEPLRTAIADAGPEVQAAYRLEQSGLSTSIDGNYSSDRSQTPENAAAKNLHDAGLTVGTADGPSPSRDQSPEGVAAVNLDKAGLTLAGKNAPQQGPAAEAMTVSGSLSEVDTVSGATVSSAAVVRAIDRAYFLLREKIIK